MINFVCTSVFALWLSLSASVTATVFSDNFNRGNTTASADFPVSVGPEWKNGNPSGGTAGIRNNAVSASVSGTNAAKFTMIYTAAETRNEGAGAGFTLSAVTKINNANWIGLVVNYRDENNFYQFRYNGGSGSIQFIPFVNGVPVGPFLLGQDAKFAAVPNRPYKLTVFSSEPYRFDVSIVDTVTGETVFSKNGVIDRLRCFKDGYGGVFAGGGSPVFDDFNLTNSSDRNDTVETPADNSPVTLAFDARKAGLTPAPLGRWGGTSPDGHVLSANNYYLELDGKPLPLVIGEMHPQRYPVEYWEEAILEMKAAGLNGISFYVFWSQIEPRPGEFDFDGNNDLRRFVELCAKHGMYVWLRIGPFNNSEFMLGGLPAWLYGMPLTERSNHPLYLELVGRYFEKLGEHLNKQMWEQGGSVIGIQLENELGVAGVSWDRIFPQHISAGGFTGLKGQDYADHYRNLKRLAVGGGLNAPFFSCTGWGLNENKPIPYDEVFPTELGYMGGYYYHRLTDKNWLTLFNTVDHILKPYWGKCPVGLSEIGTGLPTEKVAFNREPLPPETYSCAALTRVAAMPTIFAGYYLFHGGSNPLDAVHGWTVKRQDKYPQINYDFQSPIGEFGAWLPALYHLRPFNHFLTFFGEELARTEVCHPADPVITGDDIRMRAVARMNGDSGFIFFNNYGCVVDLPARPDTHFSIETTGGQITVPRAVRLDIPSNAFGILPVNLNLGGVKLLSATVQPVCRFMHDGQAYYIFSQISGMPCELVLEKNAIIESAGAGAKKSGTKQPDGAQVFSVTPARSPALTLKAADGTLIHIIVLTQSDTQNLAVFHQQDKTLLTLSSSAVTFDGLQLCATPVDSSEAEINIFPPAHNASPAALNGIFQKLTLSAPARKIEPVIEKFAPNKWVLKIPESAFDGLNDIYMDISYTGSACRIFDIQTGQMIADQFKFEASWRVGLKRFRTQLAGKGLWIRIDPDRSDVILPDNPEIVTGSASENQSNVTGFPSQLNQIKFIPEYRSVLNLQ